MDGYIALQFVSTESESPGTTTGHFPRGPEDQSPLNLDFESDEILGFARIRDIFAPHT